MFTGIILEVGTVASATRKGGNVVLRIGAPQVAPQLAVHDSVCINGVCLTVTASTAGAFEVEAVEETLTKTTIGKLGAGDRVNLEPALRVGDRLGGHIVQGHVDCAGTIARRTDRGGSWLFEIAFPPSQRRYLVPVGSIAVDGISLTVASVSSDQFAVSVIPYTFENTALRHARTGDRVNLEFDIMGKYAESMIRGAGKGEGISRDRLRQWGYESD